MKCLDQQGLKYLWSLIENKFATNDEVSSKCNEVTSGLTTQINNHTGNTGNPHNVTKAQIGLGEFDYEEGSWSIEVYTDRNVTVAPANVSNAQALYKKIGKLVYIWGMFSTKTAVPCFSIGGLPFTSPVDFMTQKRSIMIWKYENAETVGTNAYVGTSGISVINNRHYSASDTSYQWYIEGWYFIK